MPRFLQRRPRAIAAIAFACAVALAISPWRSHAQPVAPAPNNLVYEIFVRSFADGDHDPKGIGDLKGIVSRLDGYLNDGKPETDTDLEVGILWLMPIFPSPSYHGYDVTDYRGINPDYGTMADFTTLIAEAHKRGVRVILDIPFNHTSNRHPWFREAVDNPSSPRRKFYSIESDTPPPRDGPWHSITSQSGERLRYFGLFSPEMPDLNYDNPDVRREVEDIAKFWLDRGVDGFRLDAAKHIYGKSFAKLTEGDILRNNEWWREFSDSVYRIAPQAVLVGEVLGDPELLRRHAWGLGGLLDEPYMNDVRNDVDHPGAGLVSRHKQFIEQARELHRTAHDPTLPSPEPPFESYPFLASHDRNPRLASDLEDKAHHGMRYSVDEAYRLSLYILLTMSSHPVLYQGDEIMQRGWKWNGNPRTDRNSGDGSGIFDETLREPFQWFASGQGPGQTQWFPPRFDFPNDGVSREEQDRTGGMLNLARGLTNLRKRHSAFANGDIGTIASDSADWMVFERVSGDAHYLVLINLTPTGQDYRFHVAWLPQYRGADLLFWSDGHQRTWRDTSADGQRISDSVLVPPIGLVVLRQR